MTTRNISHVNCHPITYKRTMSVTGNKFTPIEPPPKTVRKLSRLCPFHDTSLTEDQTHVYCKKHLDCPFWVAVTDGVREWVNELSHQPHLEIKEGPWYCFCHCIAKLTRYADANKQDESRFLLTCGKKDKELQCSFSQPVDQPWSDEIMARRREEDGIHKAIPVPSLSDERLEVESRKFVKRNEWIAQHKKKWFEK